MSSARVEYVRRLRGTIVRDIEAELGRAYSKHGGESWGAHEFYAILKEEVDELWDAIKADKPRYDQYGEIIQIAAMCFRYIETGGNRYSADRPQNYLPELLIDEPSMFAPESYGG